MIGVVLCTYLYILFTHRYNKYIFTYDIIRYHIIEGSLEAKLPTIWTDGKASQQ